MKKMYIKDLVMGDILLKELFVVKSWQEEKEYIRLHISDRSGSMDAVIRKSNTDGVELIKNNTNQVFAISGPVLKRDGQLLEREVKIRDIILADKYLPNELYEGISKEKAKEYISEINLAKEKVTHEGYKALLDACLTEENLDKLSRYPATHHVYGVYVGGALAATCTITYMTMNCAGSYVRRGNGISTTAPDWNLLITASLLHQIGRLFYYDEADPFRKSMPGIAMNYFSTLQSFLESVIRKENIFLTDMDLALLLNVLNVATQRKTCTRAVSKDGTFLRKIIQLYGECDAYDWCMANTEFMEGNDYMYDSHTNRYYLSGYGQLIGSEE